MHSHYISADLLKQMFAHLTTTPNNIDCSNNIDEFALTHPSAVAFRKAHLVFT